jgi:hypothetical protein
MWGDMKQGSRMKQAHSRELDVVGKQVSEHKGIKVEDD